MKRRVTNGWMKIDAAPINVAGHVWSPDAGFDNRTDIIGTVHEGIKHRIVSSATARGYNFTHFHRLLKPPGKDVL